MGCCTSVFEVYEEPVPPPKSPRKGGAASERGGQQGDLKQVPSKKGNGGGTGQGQKSKSSRIDQDGIPGDRELERVNSLKRQTSSSKKKTPVRSASTGRTPGNPKKTTPRTNSSRAQLGTGAGGGIEGGVKGGGGVGVGGGVQKMAQREGNGKGLAGTSGSSTSSADMVANGSSAKSTPEGDGSEDVDEGGTGRDLGRAPSRQDRGAGTGGGTPRGAPEGHRRKASEVEGAGAGGAVGDVSVAEEEMEEFAGRAALRQFSFKELKKATKQFSVKLGEGGFGSVYKGRITPLDPRTGRPKEEGRQMSVAVKELNPDSLQGEQEWKAEVEHLANLKHRHVVRLLGYCREGPHWLLVYEFVPYGSFDYHIFAQERPPVKYADRLKVALHAARGLQYLHENNVIYRDFKTSNILVDGKFNAKLADFGLAREGPGESGTHVSTGVKGTVCYMAPEYMTSGHLTQKCDVFSFGVVLLEVLSGRQASWTKDTVGNPQMRLVELASRIGRTRGRHHEFLDARLKGPEGASGGGAGAEVAQGLPAKAFKIILNAALSCLDREDSFRPEMKTVVDSLAVAHELCLQLGDQDGS